MYLYIYIYVHIHMHMYIHANRKYTIYIYVYIYIYICRYTCMCIHECVWSSLAAAPYCCCFWGCTVHLSLGVVHGRAKPAVWLSLSQEPRRVRAAPSKSWMRSSERDSPLERERRQRERERRLSSECLLVEICVYRESVFREIYRDTYSES